MKIILISSCLYHKPKWNDRGSLLDGGLTPEIVVWDGCFPKGPGPPNTLSDPFWMNQIQGPKCIIRKPFCFFCTPGARAHKFEPGANMVEIGVMFTNWTRFRTGVPLWIPSNPIETPFSYCFPMVFPMKTILRFSFPMSWTLIHISHHHISGILGCRFFFRRDAAFSSERILAETIGVGGKALWPTQIARVFSWGDHFPNILEN